VKNKQRLVVLFGALAALIALLAIVPVFGADATQRFPDPGDTTKVLSWSRQGTNITSGAPFIVIEVTDADLNVGASVTNNAETTCSEDANFTIDRFTGTTGTVTSSAAVSPPILDNNSDGVVDYNDVSTSNANIAVESVNALNGSVTFRCTAAHTNTQFTYTYKKGAVDMTAVSTATTGNVTVTSDADPNGLAVRLEETSAQTGIFRAYVKLISDSTTSTATCLTATGCGGGAVVGSVTTTAADSLAEGLVANGTWGVGSILVNASDTLVFKYVDTSSAGAAVTRSASLSIETTAPAFTNPSPAHSLAQSNNLPTVTADVSDDDSAVDSTSITVIWALDTSSPADGIIDTGQVVQSTVAAGNITAITGGHSFEQQFPSASAVTADHTIYWWIKTTDKAGNIGVSDRQPIISGAADTCDPTDSVFTSTNLVGKDVATTADIAGCQPYAISVDRTSPDMTAAVTGSSWDAAKTTTDKTETDVTKAVNTSIRVDFDGDLDSTTVDLTDFEVDDNTPLDLALYTAKPASVFLTVNALEPNARPKIEVVGELKDKAGNKLAADSIANATDGIAPTLTLTPTDRPVTKGAQSITITSNENASTATIVLEVTQITNTTTAQGTPTSVPVTGGPSSWTGTITPSANGLYNVRAEATDVNVTTNTATAGSATAGAAVIDLTKATLFEVDNGVPTPTFIPSSTTDDANAIISINFENEGKEYGLDSSSSHTNTPGDVVTSFDSHKTVTVSSATLDAVDIAADISSADNIQFLYKHASALTVGDHTLVIKVKDEAGNEVEFTNTFKVTERAAFSIPMVPGWNMVSFPADPTDPAIDSVIGTTVPVTSVMAYQDGVWLVATRELDADGVFTAFAGNLTSIDSQLGYWVYTDTFEPIKTLIPRMAGGAADGSTPSQPPTVKIVPGWNLVPVLDVTGDKTSAAADDVDADVYFASLANVTRVYSFDTQLSTWSAIVLNASDTTGDKVEHGKAYWVYSTKAGALAP
jgi:hypothetical protein